MRQCGESERSTKILTKLRLEMYGSRTGTQLDPSTSQNKEGTIPIQAKDSLSFDTMKRNDGNKR